MKKRIIVFVVFSLLCFALVGCAQRDDEAKGSADDAYESSQTAGGNASSDNDADLSDATDLPETNESEDIGDVDGTSGADGGGYTRNADGSYTWQVGYYELTTTINVWDYIDGDVWNANDMLAAIGWEPHGHSVGSVPEVDYDVVDPSYYTYDNIMLKYSSYAPDSNPKRNSGIHAMVKGTGEILFFVTTAIDYGEHCYLMNGADAKSVWSLEGIVCFAYGAEQLKESREDPFDGIFYLGEHFDRY